MFQAPNCKTDKDDLDLWRASPTHSSSSLPPSLPPPYTFLILVYGQLPHTCPPSVSPCSSQKLIRSFSPRAAILYTIEGNVPGLHRDPFIIRTSFSLALIGNNKEFKVNSLKASIASTKKFESVKTSYLLYPRMGTPHSESISASHLPLPPPSLEATSDAISFGQEKKEIGCLACDRLGRQVVAILHWHQQATTIRKIDSSDSRFNFHIMTVICSL